MNKRKSEPIRRHLRLIRIILLRLKEAARVKKAAAFLMAVLMTVLSGCSAYPGGQYYSETEHETVSSQVTEGAYSAGTFDELVDAIVEMVSKYERNGTIIVRQYDGNLEKDVAEACSTVSYDTALGSFAVYYMTSNVNKIVSYYQVDIAITYKTTKSQLKNMIAAETKDDIWAGIDETIEDYGSYVSFLTTYKNVDEDDIEEYIEGLYREDPEGVVFMPVLNVEIHDERWSDSGERIIHVGFDYPYITSLMAFIEKDLVEEGSVLAARLRGANPDLTLLNICNYIHENVYVVGRGTHIVEGWDHADTAYGALIEGVATSQGIALAYKALCGRLGMNCTVVEGQYNGSVHYWNLVELGGRWYHSDMSNCARYGFENMILMNDTTLQQYSEYWWNTSDVRPCTGERTYADLVD